MACQVDQANREVTFLYKLVDGVCEKSYGMNVAHMAGVPREIVDRAEEMAQEFELKQETKREEDLRLTRGTKNVGLGMVMDLAYLLSRAGRSDSAAEETLVDAEMEAEEGQNGSSLTAMRARSRSLSKEQETRVFQRIFKAMASL
jgi:DNA mismatch repair protein MSH6